VCTIYTREYITKQHNCHNVNWNLLCCFKILLFLHTVFAFESLWSDHTTNIYMSSRQSSYLWEKYADLSWWQIYSCSTMWDNFFMTRVNCHMFVVSFKWPPYKCNFYLIYLTCCMHFEDELWQPQLLVCWDPLLISNSLNIWFSVIHPFHHWPTWIVLPSLVTTIEGVTWHLALHDKSWRKHHIRYFGRFPVSQFDDSLGGVDLKCTQWVHFRSTQPKLYFLKIMEFSHYDEYGVRTL
jgi:hypothetical protein